MLGQLSRLRIRLGSHFREFGGLEVLLLDRWQQSSFQDKATDYHHSKNCHSLAVDPATLPSVEDYLY